MPKLPSTDTDAIDIDEMEEAEYNESDFDSYDGEQPPKGTLLRGSVTKIWWTVTRNDDPMFKVLFVADGNDGDEEEYNGLPIWENIALIPTAKFRWKPFIDCFGITLKEIKTKTMVEAEDDQFGAPIQKIGTWAPDTEAAECSVVTSRHRYDGNWQTDVGKWLLPTEADDEEPGEEEPEEEPEEEAPRATRSRRSAAAPAKAATPARGGRGGTRTAKAPASRTAKAGTRSRARTAASDDEPPF